MIDEIKRLVNNYQSWLNQKYIFKQIDDWVEITTPFLDRHNDSLQIYIKRTNGEYILTDDGYIIQDLLLSGCNIDTEKREKLLQITLNGFGVKKDRDRLVIKATESNFPIKKHNLVQAMLAVNDLFYLAEPKGTQFFVEKVSEWLDENEIRYSPRVKFSGISGYDHIFDFVIPKSREKPERVLQAINNPNKTNAENFIFSFFDAQRFRDIPFEGYAMLNDEAKISTDVQYAFSSYDISSILWSKRKESLVVLSA
jgi:hypothetical protein